MSMFEVFLDDIDLTEQKKFIHTLSRKIRRTKQLNAWIS